MKKNDLILGAALVLYCYLFYNQSAGINFLLYTLAMIGCIATGDKSLLKNKSWLAVALGSLLSGICVAVYGNTSSVVCNVLSLSLMANLSINKESSVVFVMLYALYTYLTSLLFIFMENKERRQTLAPGLQSVTVKLSVTVIPVFIFILFFFIYREANPLFKKFTENINFDFISWAWIRFTLLGFILLYGFFHPKQVTYLLKMESSASDNLGKESLFNENFFKRMNAILNEFRSGILLFVLLNFLLLLVNVLDIHYIWISKTLPEGISYSDFVHQGIYALVVSIIMAIIIILYYFRGLLNFHEGNKILKILAYLWIIQNAVLIITSAAKNNIYIGEYSLTYKRIGVYIYLFLALIGLVTTFIKILKIKSNWFLIRKNGWAFYCVFVFCCCFNWDLIVTRYNIHYSKNLDRNYLLSLSDAVIPELMRLSRPVDKAWQAQEANKDFMSKLDDKKEFFLLKQKYAYWQSWNITDHRTLNEINSLNIN